MAELKENNIEWLNGQEVVTVTLSQGRYINRVKKLAQKYKEVEILAENEDGSIVAHIPLKFIKMSAPKQMSEEQKERARERLKAMHNIK